MTILSELGQGFERVVAQGTNHGMFFQKVKLLLLLDFAPALQQFANRAQPQGTIRHRCFASGVEGGRIVF